MIQIPLYHYKRAIIGPPAKTQFQWHFVGVSPYDGPTLSAGLVVVSFQGIRTNIAILLRNPIIW